MAWPTVDELAPIDAGVLADVLLMIEVGSGGWARKRELVAHIGAHSGGRWWDPLEFEHLSGLSAARSRVLMRELARDRVILRDGGDGDRVFWCEVNPAVLEWLRVPWRVDRFELAARVTYFIERSMSTWLERFIARPMHDRYARVIARHSPARSAVVKPLRSVGYRAPHGPRDNPDGGPPHRALKDRAMPGDASRGHGARDVSTGALGRALDLPAADADDPTLALLRERGASADPATVAAAVRVIVERARVLDPKAHGVYGITLAWLMALVAEHGAQVVQVARDCPRDLGPPAAVKWVAGQLTAPPPVDGITLPTTESVIDESKRQLRAQLALDRDEAGQRAAHYRQMVERAGEFNLDPDQVEWYAEQRDSWAAEHLRLTQACDELDGIGGHEATA